MVSVLQMAGKCNCRLLHGKEIHKFFMKADLMDLNWRKEHHVQSIFIALAL